MFFEPSKYLFESYLKFIDPRVYVNNFALADSGGFAALYQFQNDLGLSSLTNRRLEHFSFKLSGTENIEKRTLDNYIKEKSIKKIDLLKIDVEGHEIDVLNAAKDALQMNIIKCIQFEFGGCNIDIRTYLQDFWYLLVESYGFSLYRISPFGIHRVNEYTELDEFFLTTNYIAYKL
jgi:FkbM family methyltransferase